MTDAHESIKLTRRDIRSLEEEQKELRRELNQVPVSRYMSGRYHSRQGEISDKLYEMEKTLESKRAALDTLLQSQQLTMF